MNVVHPFYFVATADAKDYLRNLNLLEAKCLLVDILTLT